MGEPGRDDFHEGGAFRLDQEPLLQSGSHIPEC